MSYYTAYTMLFTGDMNEPNYGVKINDYKNFNHIINTVHDEWAFSPKLDWEVSNKNAYPKEEYAYLYGYVNHTEEIYILEPDETWSLNKCGQNSELFYSLWTATSMVCEPFSVLMYPGLSNFPRLNELVYSNLDTVMYRLDCQPGKIEIIEFNLITNEEKLEDVHEWNISTYEDEYFLNGINY